MDVKDVKILSLLSQNARSTYSQIGRGVMLSSDSVKLRIKKMFKDGILKAFKTGINYNALGFMEYDIYFKLKNYNEKELEEIITYFSKEPSTTWIGTCFGNYDLRVSMIVKNNHEVDKFILNFEKKYASYYLDSKIVFVVEKYKIPFKMLFGNLFDLTTQQLHFMPENKFRNILEVKKDEKTKDTIIKLNKTDKKIIEILSKKPEVSLVDIGHKLKMTAEAVKYRITSLSRKGVLTSFSAVVDSNKLNKIRAVFLFKLNNYSSKEFLNFIGNQKNVSATVRLLGEWNFSVSLLANNMQEIHNILMNFRNRFPDLIREYEMLLLFETYKYPHIPKVVWE